MIGGFAGLLSDLGYKRKRNPPFSVQSTKLPIAVDSRQVTMMLSIANNGRSDWNFQLSVVNRCGIKEINKRGGAMGGATPFARRPGKEPRNSVRVIYNRQSTSVTVAEQAKAQRVYDGGLLVAVFVDKVDWINRCFFFCFTSTTRKHLLFPPSLHKIVWYLSCAYSTVQLYSSHTHTNTPHNSIDLVYVIQIVSFNWRPRFQF